MTTNYHDPIVNGDARKNDAAIWNDPLGELDAQITANTSELVTARNGYQNLDTRLDGIDDTITALVLENGTSDAEVIAARTAINYKVGSPPATLSAALEYAAGNVYNVLAYGAVADGATDISTAVQAAIDAAEAAGGGRVWMPKASNKYKLTGDIELKSNVWLMGDGAVIDTDGNTNSVLIYAIGKTNIRISGLQIEGQGTDGAGNSVVPISMDGCSRVWIENNYIDLTPVEDDVNTVALRISDDPAATDNATNDYADIWITNNVIRPVSLGILAQSRLSQDCEMSRLYVIGNTIDYANIDADTQNTDFPAALKVDLNVRESVIANNILYGRGFCRDGINVQEDLHDVVITGNIVRGFDNYGIAVDAGQTVAEVQDVIVSNNIVTGMVGATSRAISISCATATTWKNVSVLGNTINNCAGFGIYENGEGNRIANYIVEGNTLSENGASAIYVRSHRALIASNTVKTASSVACVTITGTALNCAIIGNRLDSASGAIIDTGSGTIVRDNIIDDAWTPGTKSETVVTRWSSGEYWSIESFVTGLTITNNTTTTIDLGIDVLPFGSTARGAYICTGEIVGGSSSSNVTAASFVAWMRMTDASTVSSQGGIFPGRSSTSLTNTITLDTDLTNFQLKIGNNNVSESSDNVMIRFRLQKSASL